MKKYLIQFMCVDMPSIEDDGVCGGTNFGVHKQAFNSREEAKLEQAKQIFQKIKAELGNVSDYDVVNYIKYMNDNRYSLYK